MFVPPVFPMWMNTKGRSLVAARVVLEASSLKEGDEIVTFDDCIASSPLALVVVDASFMAKAWYIVMYFVLWVRPVPLNMVHKE